MLKHPEFDPVAISIPDFTIFGFTLGPIDVHWYGIMYLCGFAVAWFLGMHRAAKPWTPLARKQIEDLIFYAALGLVLGARFGYVFFYNFSEFLQRPLWLFKVWDGGMSFHGGAIGVMVAMAMYCRKVHRHFVDVMDFVVPLAPLGLAFGRLGNFIGQELWGRETSVPWGMVFPKDPELLVRHPSQLYQMFFEGFVLFAILFWFSRKPRLRGVMSGLFLLVYGCVRFAVEFVRQPDAHLNFVAFGWMTRGQQLCIPMILFGVALIYWGYNRKIFAPGKSLESTGEAQTGKQKKSKNKTKKKTA